MAHNTAGPAAAWQVTSNLWVAEAPGRPPRSRAEVVGGLRRHRMSRRRYREWLLGEWELAPRAAPEVIVIVDRRIDHVPIRRAMWPAGLHRVPVPERGVRDQPMIAFGRLIESLVLMARHQRIIVVGGQPHTTVVALAVLVSACGSITQGHELYAPRGAAELPLNWDRFLTGYLLRFELPYMMTRREIDG